MGNNNPTQLDQQQILQRAFDSENDRLRTDGVLNVEVGQLEIAISANEDSIAISDGTNTLAVNTNGSLNTTPQPYVTRVDEATSTVTYIGYAAPGSNASGGVWKILRMTSSGTETLIQYADGNANFDNVWNNRASLTYV